MLPNGHARVHGVRRLSTGDRLLRGGAVNHFRARSPVVATDAVADWLSIHLRMRRASAVRVRVPNEFRNTMMTGRSSIVVSMTRHWPASLVKPVFCTRMSQSDLPTSRLV